jgi:hypothetical protein
MSLGHGRLGQLRRLHFSGPSPGNPFPSIQRRLMGHSVEPVADHLSGYDGSGFTDKEEEGRLKSILGIVAFEEPAAHALDHGAVPHHEGFKSRFFSATHEALQQLPIRLFHPPVRERQLAQPMDDRLHVADRHPFSSLASLTLYLYVFA